MSRDLKKQYLVLLAMEFQTAMEDAEEEYPGIQEDVWNAVKDAALLARPDLQESLQEARDGLLTPAEGGEERDAREAAQAAVQDAFR